MDALIQWDRDNNRPLNENTNAAMLGLEFLGFNIEPFDFEDLCAEKVNLGEDRIVIGGIGAIRNALEQMGKADPPQLDYPDALKPWLYREITATTMGEMRGPILNGDHSAMPFFIKPRCGQKEFVGFHARQFRDFIPSAHIDGRCAVWVSTPIDFMTEYRCFVLRGEVLQCSQYKGDPLLFPSATAIGDMVRAYRDAPVAYSLDVGVVRDGDQIRTALIEVNDSFSLGRYGLDRIDYARMLWQRWVQLMES